MPNNSSYHALVFGLTMKGLLMSCGGGLTIVHCCGGGGLLIEYLRTKKNFILFIEEIFHGTLPHMPSPQARYWILTIPQHHFLPYLPPGIDYIAGQLERGDNTDYVHWQLVAYFRRKCTLTNVKSIFGQHCHAERTRSSAAGDYVFKDETAISNTRFELGSRPKRRNSAEDWESVWDAAKRGDIISIPADIRIRCYNTIKRIKKDYAAVPWRETIVVNVFWGPTGTGKSHTAYQEASESGPFYVKGPTTKWWDSYQGEVNVIMDEFRGQISIEHLLRWFDKYPCYVEEKGGQAPLLATKFWICSNLNPQRWYPNCDQETINALLRRLTIKEFN